MERRITAPRHWRALRSRLGTTYRTNCLRADALRPHHYRARDVGRRDLAQSRAGERARQQCALAELVSAVEPDFAEEIAERLMAQFGTLGALLDEPEADLFLATGNRTLAKILRKAKPLVIASLLSDLSKVPFSPANQDVLRYVTAIMAGLACEEAHAFFLDSRLSILRHEIFAYGSEKSTDFPMHIIFRRAIQIGATELVLIHNHPSGSAEPSDQDLVVTRQIASAGRCLGISVHDHLIVAESRVFSFRAAGLL